MAEQEKISFITTAKSEDYNHVIVLKQVLEESYNYLMSNFIP